MNSSMNAASSVQTAETKEQQMAAALAQWWWAWLVAGIVWILASIVILQFKHASDVVAGIIIGIMFLVAGAQEFVVAVVADSWKWVRITLGALLLIGGVYALFNPVGTFLALADALAFLFALIGIFWVIEAFATLTTNDFWWMGLIAGFVMLGLAFWAAGQFFATNVYALLVGVGIWALLHGIADIIRAFVVKNRGELIAA